MPRKKTNKTKLTLTVDKNLVDSAKEVGINISAFLEYHLRQYLSLMKIGFPTDIGWARRDLNPRPPGYEPGALTWLSYGP